MDHENPRKLTKRDWGWIHFKASIGILWPIFILIARGGSAEAESTVSPVLLYGWMGVVAAGAALCIYGIITRATAVQAARYVRGTATELAGIVLMFSGPFLLLCLYLGIAVAHQNERYLTAVGLLHAICAVMLARFLEVYPTRRRPN